MTDTIDLRGVTRAGRRPPPAAREAPVAPVALGAVRLRPDVIDPPHPAPAPERASAPPAIRQGRPPPAWRRPAGVAPSASRVMAGMTLIAAYVAFCLAPLALVSIGSHAPHRPFLVELSVALGYVGLAMMVLQFTLVSRIKWLAAPFGIDILQRFHRQVSFVALAFVLAHPALLLVQSLPTYLPLFDLRTAPWRARFAVASVAALLLVVFVSLWRRKLRLPYEVWKVTHGVLSVSVLFLALAHMVGVNRFTSSTGGRIVVVVVAAAIFGVLVWSRLIAPHLHGFRPWRVVDVIAERGRAITLVMEPDRHSGWSFLPGQFAWVSVGRSAYRPDHHPFSISSPADADTRGRVAMTIKEAGDWTKDVGSIDPGTRVHMDGPHGSFSMDLHQAPGYVFVAGGVGITPIYSMIATMFLREDTRPVVLFYTNPDWESVTFREQLDELSGYMRNLRVVHVLKQPPAGWRGPSGRLSADVLAHYLPRQYRTFEYFLCGSTTMMDAVEDALLQLGVDDYRIHSERFGIV